MTTDAATFSSPATLRDGRAVEIRALRRDDRAAMLQAVEHMSAEARQLRFFAPKRSFSEAETDYYVNVDFVQHVALVAVIDDHGAPRIAGGGRYIVAAPGRAEVAFGIDNAFQGQGLGGILLGHLVALARDAGLRELVAEVLPENAPMLKVFRRSGLPMQRRTEDGVVHVSLALG
jgi:RimJ/RimL family protein N-acetyltransferase